MKRIFKMLRAYWMDESGAETMEWLIVLFVAVGLIAVVLAISAIVKNKASEVEDVINNLDLNGGGATGAGGGELVP